MSAATRQEYIEALVSKAPKLSVEQIEKLRALLPAPAPKREGRDSR